jgi:hypothetical protein
VTPRHRRVQLLPNGGEFVHDGAALLAEGEERVIDPAEAVEQRISLCLTFDPSP